MVTIGGAESAPPRGKEDILKAVGIRVKSCLLHIKPISNEGIIYFVFINFFSFDIGLGII